MKPECDQVRGTKVVREPALTVFGQATGGPQSAFNVWYFCPDSKTIQRDSLAPRVMAIGHSNLPDIKPNPNLQLVLCHGHGWFLNCQKMAQA